MVTDLEDSKHWNTFRSVIDIITNMSSSSGDELPDIPGTRYPWMEDAGPSTSSRSPRKTKRPRVSAVEKEKKLYKEPRKKTTIRMEMSSDDDDFEDPKPQSSQARRPPATPKPSAVELRRQKVKEKVARCRAKKSAAELEMARVKDAQRRAAARANETPEQHRQRNQANAQQTAAARANETPAEHARRNQLDAERHAAARANETPEQHVQRNQANAERQAVRRANRTPDQVLRDRSANRQCKAASRKYFHGWLQRCYQEPRDSAGNIRGPSTGRYCGYHWEDGCQM